MCVNAFGYYFSESGPVSRRFLINHLYNGCPRDVGWMFVMDTDHPLKVCPEWEIDLDFDGRKRRVVKSDLPQFLYCPPPNMCRWHEGE